MLWILLIVNLSSFLLMYIDKLKANRKAWRIPEKTLFTVAFLGGSIGVWLGMYAFRHKTRKLKFKIGIPAIILLQAALLIIINQYVFSLF